VRRQVDGWESTRGLWLLGLEAAVRRLVGAGCGDDSRPHTHVGGVVMKLFPALETGNVGLAVVAATFTKWGDRPCEVSVAAAKQQVNHRNDHILRIVRRRIRQINTRFG